MDIATGFAMSLIGGYSANDGLWVPLGYGSVRVHAPLPKEIWSYARLSANSELDAGIATFDVTIADSKGRVLVDVERFTIMRSGADLARGLREDTAGTGKVASRQPREMSPAQQRLAAQVEQGILPAEGAEALLRALTKGHSQIIVSSLDLAELKKSQEPIETRRGDKITFSRPDAGANFVAPRNDIEAKLAEFWTELLGIQKVGVNDDFFDLGGHSLIAVRLFRKVKSAFAVDIPISALIEAPTIAQCAELLAELVPSTSNDTTETATSTVARPQFRHIVQMHQCKTFGRTPFFICAGMFGNILNLRHLATQIGKDRTVYGLQARGIYGDEQPHETFEEMARDYLAEVRVVQPTGPYLLGGFSGGGLVAFEMARQLNLAGETVAQLIMLDTPYPEHSPLTAIDRALMKWQDLQRDGSAFLANWIRRRIAWERARLHKDQNPAPLSNEQFHNAAIEAAFYRALGRFVGQPYAGSAINFRPVPEVAYRVTGGRLLDFNRSLVRADNGWSPIIAKLRMIQVPGTHDSMVLEPNVRVLAAIIREELRIAEANDSLLIAAE